MWNGKCGIRSSVFLRQTGKTKAAPEIVREPTGLPLGTNAHAGISTAVRLTAEQRVRHIHIIGASGTGKSTLLYNLIREDIETGQGVAVFDPHGDLVDRILGIIPQHRIQDVVVIDPSDEEYSVGFNILSAHSDLEKNLLASDLVSVFERLSTSWGDQMGSVLNNAILVFLESNRRGTLADLRRFLIESAFRNEFLKSVNDPDLVYYWQKVFPQLSGNKSIGSVLTRLDTFLAPKPIRHMVSQTENRLDFGRIMDTGKIFLAKLSQGLLGKENSYLLGALLVSKFQQHAMSRQAQREALRREFWVYVDEFHNFITPSMAEILSGARKYRIGLILAHQEFRQLQRDPEVASAVLSNPYTRICFRLGDEDARKLREGFSSFSAQDLQNLGTGEALVRVERSQFDFNLAIPQPDYPEESDAVQRRREAIAASRNQYASPRAMVEAALRKAFEPTPTAEQSAPKPTPPAKPATAVSVETVVTAQPTPRQPRTNELPETQLPASPQSKPHTPSDLGRGGAQHQAIQKRIKEAAESLGFRSSIEKPVLNGQGSVDLLLERPGQTIACEISITTTIDHEVGNVAKCLKAGFATVAVICVRKERLKKIETAVVGSLGPEAATHVQYYRPDEFISNLTQLLPTASEAPKQPEVRRGYVIRRSVIALSPAEQKRREETAISSIAEAMLRKSVR